MNIEIYYFSGTGNSLAVARDLAEKTGAALVSIPAVMDRPAITSQAEAIGIVFPSYYETLGGVPLIVLRFVDRLRDIGAKYIFSVCTYGSGTIAAWRTLAKRLRARGGKLSAHAAVNMPENIDPLVAREKHRAMFDVWKRSVPDLAAFVGRRGRGAYHVMNSMVGRAYPLLMLIGAPLLAVFRGGTVKSLQLGARSDSRDYGELMSLMDKSFSVSDKCNGCRICVRVCPAGNIDLAGGRPVWKHRCEYCLACFHWCPPEAIISSVLKSDVKYHHPDVRLSDMFLRK